MLLVDEDSVPPGDYGAIIGNTDKSDARDFKDEEEEEEIEGTQITLISNESTASAICDSLRVMMSTCILIFSIIAGCYAIFHKHTLMPDQINNFLVLGAMVFSLFGLGLFEGLQIAVVEMAHEKSEHIRPRYPRAAAVMDLMARDSGVQRFLIGRQVMVIFFVFVLAKVTSYNGFIDGTPKAITHGIMYSGLLGALLTVIIAQLTPQVLAAAFPREFLNIPFMHLPFRFALFVEWTGIAHAVWLLCTLWCELVMKGARMSQAESHAHEQHAGMTALLKCENEILVTTAMDDDNPNDNSVETASNIELLSRDAALAEAAGESKRVKITTTTITPTDIEKSESNNSGSTILSQTENNESMLSKKKKLRSKDVISKETVSEFDVESWMTDCFGEDSLSDEKLSLLIESVSRFNGFPSPVECAKVFSEAGCNKPRFLTDPSDPKHIPPHIVCLELLKMFSAQKKH